MMSRKSAATDGRGSTGAPGLGMFGMGVTSAYPRGGWGKPTLQLNVTKEQTGYQINMPSLAAKKKSESLCCCKVLKKVPVCQEAAEKTWGRESFVKRLVG